MKADNSFSSLSISEKRKRLMAMLDMRAKRKIMKREKPSIVETEDNKMNSKKPNYGSTKVKKLNGHKYKKLFQIARKKVKKVSRKMVKKVSQGGDHIAAYEVQEYWVPVHLSTMQIQQYCSLLHSNIEALSSSLRNSSSLHDILTQTQKCCDHPYLMDPTLRNSLKTDVQVNRFDAEISVSGKLQLLDKLLVEIKQCGLRVLVLFQSVVSSKNVSVGDILDDLVDQRFGQLSYVRIHGKILSKTERVKRKEALNMFNNVENRMFVCLMDYRACHPSIKLSSVDVAILFNSDWNPLNDLKALHKLTLDSQSERLRVLRLYSSFTIEEKALILSKEGVNLDSNTDRMTWNTFHQLLAWGASYLLSKNSKDPSSESDSDTCFLNDLVHELSSLLVNKNGNTGALKSSIVLNAKLQDGTFPKLLGETEHHNKESSLIDEHLMENGPLVFWTNLFKESPMKNRCNRSSRRAHKSLHNPAYWFEEYEPESATTSPCVKTKLRSKRKASTQADQSKRTGARGRVLGQELPRRSSTCISDSVTSISSTNYVTNNEPSQPQILPERPPVCDQTSSAAPLETELENIKKEQEQATKLHQEKNSMLLSECEKEISEVRKKYDALMVESESCLTKKMKVLEGYYELVSANKLLAETLCDDILNEAHMGKTEKETSSVRILEIPASALVQPANQCSTSIPTGHGTRLRAPAPHLRSTSSSLFASFCNLPTIPESLPGAPHLRSSSSSWFASFCNLPTIPEPLPALSTVIDQVNTQKLPTFDSSRLWPEVPVDFDSLYDMGCPSLPFLDSN